MPISLQVSLAFWNTICFAYFAIHKALANAGCVSTCSISLPLPPSYSQMTEGEAPLSMHLSRMLSRMCTPETWKLLTPLVAHDGRLPSR